MRKPALILLLACVPAVSGDWPRFRGPDGSGVAETKGLPVEFGPAKSVGWKTVLPPGHSSPVIAGERIFVTGWEEDKLSTLALDRRSGKVLWRRDVPRERRGALHAHNTAATPTPVTDGDTVFVFFQDVGILAYSAEGRERWRLPLGPFRNVFGMAASPVLAGNTLVLVCDQDQGSHLLLIDKETGRIRHRVERTYTSYSTPLILEGAGPKPQAVVSGTMELVSYDVETGERLWWVSGMPAQPKASPVVARVGKRILVICNVLSIENLDKVLPPFPRMAEMFDQNKDGKISRDELPAEMRGTFPQIDLNGDEYYTKEEYAIIAEVARIPHTLLAVEPDGRGDITAKVQWREKTGLPNVPTPLGYQGVLYLVKEGGIVTSLDPATGRIFKRERLTGAIGTYYSSPVAGDGKIYAASIEGQVAVLKAGEQWELAAVNNFDEPIFATPAIADGRLYVRTRSALYCLGGK